MAYTTSSTTSSGTGVQGIFLGGASIPSYTGTAIGTNICTTTSNTTGFSLPLVGFSLVRTEVMEMTFSNGL